MRDFLHDRLGRGIAAVLAIKLLALLALWAAFFSAPAPSGVQAVERALLSHPESSATRSEP